MSSIDTSSCTQALCETNQTTRNSSFAEAYSKTFPDFHSPTVDCEQIDSLRSHKEHLSDVSSPAFQIILLDKKMPQVVTHLVKNMKHYIGWHPVRRIWMLHLLLIL